MLIKKQSLVKSDFLFVELMDSYRQFYTGVKVSEVELF